MSLEKIKQMKTEDLPASLMCYSKLKTVIINRQVLIRQTCFQIFRNVINAI